MTEEQAVRFGAPSFHSEARGCCSDLKLIHEASRHPCPPFRCVHITNRLVPPLFHSTRIGCHPLSLQHHHRHEHSTRLPIPTPTSVLASIHYLPGLTRANIKTKRAKGTWPSTIFPPLLDFLHLHLRLFLQGSSSLFLLFLLFLDRWVEAGQFLGLFFPR